MHASARIVAEPLFLRWTRRPCGGGTKDPVHRWKRAPSLPKWRIESGLSRRCVTKQRTLIRSSTAYDQLAPTSTPRQQPIITKEAIRQSKADASSIRHSIQRLLGGEKVREPTHHPFRGRFAPLQMHRRRSLPPLRRAPTAGAPKIEEAKLQESIGFSSITPRRILYPSPTIHPLVD